MSTAHAADRSAESPKISIITPSFRSSRWLKLCIPSVADQGVQAEHIVQDAGSDDGTLDWLAKDSRVKAFVEKDQGMYDAVNRGLRRSQGPILAYLNCDEQYLPGALSKVLNYFREHPAIDVVFADTVVIDTAGQYICHRKALIPTKLHTWVGTGLSIQTCATFFRHRLIDQHGLLFNSKLRDLGDCEWIMRLIEHRIPMGILREFTSAFTKTGANMNLLPNAQREKAEWFASAPGWARQLRHLVQFQTRFRRLVTGGYWQQAFDYAIYTESSPAARRPFHVTHPTTRWVD